MSDLTVSQKLRAAMDWVRELGAQLEAQLQAQLEAQLQAQLEAQLQAAPEPPADEEHSVWNIEGGADLAVDHWLLEQFGVPGRGLSRDSCPPDTYGTADALCHEPPGPCPGSTQCYRAWARRQMAAEREKGANDE